MSFLQIARLTVKEAARKRLLILVLVGSVLFLVLFGVGLRLLLDQFARPPSGVRSLARSEEIASLGTAMLTLLAFYALNFLAGLSAIFISVNAISGEVDTGTVHALLARPLRRWEVVIGKWLGYGVVLSVYVVAMSAGLMALSYTIGGFTPPRPIQAMALLVLMTLLILSLSILGGTFLPTLANGIGLFFLYGLAWLGGMVEVIGSAFESDTMVQIGILVSLIMPSDALWRGTSYYLQPASILLALNAGAGGGPPFFSSAPPATPMLLYSVLYTIAALGIGVVVFSRRDL